MKKLFLLVVFSFFSFNVVAFDQEPAQPLTQCHNVLLLGIPKTKMPGLGLCRFSWASLNDTQAKIPVWTAHVLTPERAVGCLARPDNFDPDLSIPQRNRAQPRDYARSGYDLGHMVPNGDMSWDAYSQYESFLMSNVAPQLPSFNRGIWKQLEDQSRALSVQKSNSLLIYAGALYRHTGTQIGTNRVVVPYAYYKIIVNLTAKRTYAFMFPHRGDLGNDLAVYQTTVKEIETAAKIEFPIIGDKTKKVSFPEVKSSAYSRAKRKHCAKN